MCTRLPFDAPTNPLQRGKPTSISKRLALMVFQSLMPLKRRTSRQECFPHFQACQQRLVKPEPGREQPHHQGLCQVKTHGNSFTSANQRPSSSCSYSTVNFIPLILRIFQ
jgi:hypothetical protein